MRKKWLFAALLIPLFLFALSRLDAQSLLHSAQQIPPWLAALLLGLQIASQLLVNLQWHRISRFTAANVSFGSMFYINCQGAVMDSITPGVKIGGEVTRAVRIRQVGNCSGEQAVAVVALQKLFSMSAFLFLALFTVGFLASEVPLLQAGYARFLVYGILLMFLSLFAGVFLAPRRIKAWLQAREAPRFSWARRARGFLLTLLDQVAVIRENAKAWVALSLLSFFIWLLYPVKLYLLVMQFPFDAHAAYVGAATFASYMVAMLPIFPGGLGGFEGTMSGLLLAMGLGMSDAVVVTVLFRFVTFWFVMLFSLGFIGLRKVVKVFTK